ncbi:general secretion pathway protein [Flavobacterium sp. H122]|uniref:general secretion pathway protein n=1 Tax=Flavobacterium sp. H122 TaxID=2529860 RepID=UPI0010AB2433|nr:general secretion pathway protein [Flavobacterium sp. H122]
MKLNRKNKFLIVGFILAFYLCYTFAISNTIKYYKEFLSQKEVLAGQNFSPKTISQLNQKEKQLDRLLENQQINISESYQNNLLKFLNTHAVKFDLKIVEFKEPHVVKANKSKELNYIFILQGSYNGIISLLNQLENNSNIGFIRHVHFIKERNYKSNIDQLFAEIVLTNN